ILLTLAGSAFGHMIMTRPVPYNVDNLDSSPLSSQGDNYPCKVQGGGYKVSQMNKWKVGSQQTLTFKGTAVHGGGSCQVAVTLDKEPTKSSKFKAIYSIEGGCPGVGGVSEFPFTVPEELPNGEYTMAWTWFNRVGNREMYMNCAPITVSGGKDDKSDFEKLPDMAVANVGGVSTCKNAEGKDYLFDHPGKYKTKTGNGPFAPLCGGGAGAPGGSPQQPVAPGGAPSQTPNTSIPSQAPNPGIPSQAPASQPVASQPTAAPTSAPAGGSPKLTSTVFTMVTVTGAPSVGSPSVASSASPSAPAAQPSAPAAPGGGAGSCGTDGEIVCQGEDQFGICNHGKVDFQPVAAGTKCQGGKIAKRAFTHRAQR
ncbi:lytic polysaccharide monooxygenase, partial [Zopfia rhizophila CBS 207.26]